MISLIFYDFFNISYAVCFCYSDKWLDLAVLLIQDFGMLEMVSQLQSSLVASVANVADFG